MTHQYDEFVKFANFLADESSIIITKYFRTKINISKKYDSVSMIGSMTYCKKPNKLLLLINN